MKRGDWVVRQRHEGGSNNSQAHRVDALVGGGVTTRCGRFLQTVIATRPNARLVVDDSADHCFTCSHAKEKK